LFEDDVTYLQHNIWQGDMLDINEFNKRSTVQLVLKDLKPSIAE
jgi:hypothetical protein